MDEGCRFTLRYPSDFTLSLPGCGLSAPGAVVTFAPSFNPSIDSTGATTNLDEVSVTVAVVRSSRDQPKPETACVVAGTDSGLPAVLAVGGQVFYRSCCSDAAAGNMYDIVSYRTTRGIWCYEVVLLLHYGNLGCYSEGTVTAFEPRRFLRILEAMVSTFRVCSLVGCAGRPGSDPRNPVRVGS